MAESAVRLTVTIGDSPSTERLRALLPEAKRLLSRQHIGAPWHALLAAETLLAELDAAREAWRREAARFDDFLRPAPAHETAEEAGP